MRNVILCLMMVGMMGGMGCGAARDPNVDQAALTAAENWLALVDAGLYEQSWDEAAPFFQGAVPKEQWESTMQAMRKPFGNNLSRTLKSAQSKTTLPGAPDGEYVVIQYKASFDNKKSAIETITPMRTDDGTWRVSGYFMK